MKKTIFTLAVVAIIAGTLMMRCKPSTKEEIESQDKVDDAREDVRETKESLAVAKKAATDAEWEAFKEETYSVIDDNEARIDALKLKMKKKGESIDAKYQKNIADLEQKNKNLKVKMDAYKNDVNSDWQSFKREFNHDKDEIGQALKDLTVDNKK